MNISCTISFHRKLTSSADTVIQYAISYIGAFSYILPCYNANGFLVIHYVEEITVKRFCPVSKAIIELV